MDYFVEVEDGFAITFSRGVFRQVKVYSRAGLLFAAFGSGFIRLNRDGATSHKSIRWEQIDIGPDGYKEDGFYLRAKS